jgi:hypothetical protein
MSVHDGAPMIWALYHENRISQVQNFVFQFPLKNIVQGRKGYLKVEKKLSQGIFFSTFKYPSLDNILQSELENKILHLKG